MEGLKNKGDIDEDEQFIDPDRKAELLELARKWKRPTSTGDYRKPGACSSGGFLCHDAALISKLRSAGKEVIYRIGKQILQGKLNLVSIAFPSK
jgi:hypothetical protein